ncbi:hypothetical protein M9Q43_07330 [Flavobacterium sp. HXWNR29]|uniref:hypothetical protein n=1 Tax=Flavobacterium TaxID=237 RepID=UPI0004790E7E|nr:MULTISPECIES: hypothetical protein [Flavobacterium]MCU4188975.1 hypothetical protein [Flavobacterium sp. HXWNR29]
MVPDINRKISFTLKEYKEDYNILLQEYLSKHEDFEEKQFIELEIDFYNLCYSNANLIKSYYDGKYIYSVNGGHCEVLIPKIYDSLVTFKDENDGWDIELSLKYKATFEKIISFLRDKQNNLGKKINSIKNIEVIPSEPLNKFYPNLINDPLFFEGNDYVKIKNDFVEEYQSRTSHLSGDEDFLFFEADEEFTHWEETKKTEIKNEFIKLTKQLNKDNIFFFGCSFENYKNNYLKRLNLFLENYDDTSETDFIQSEKTFLQNLMYDFENGTGDVYEFSKSDVEVYKKASYVVSMISFEQYCYSNNKKMSFLEEKLLGNNNFKKEEVNIIEKTESLTTTINLNDSFINDIILEKLEDVLSNVNTTQYGLLVDMLNKYFQNDRVSFKVNKINLGRINKKKVGWALKEIYTTITNEGLTYEYLAFLKENVLLFKDVELNKDDFFYCNLYKYFTTKV